MSEVKKIATRESYGRTLAQLGAENPNIVVLDADLAGSTKTGVFQKAFPDRQYDEYRSGTGRDRHDPLCEFLCDVRVRPRL